MGALPPTEAGSCCDSCGQDFGAIACFCRSRVCRRRKPGSVSDASGVAVRGRGEVGYRWDFHCVRPFLFDEGTVRGVARPASPTEGRGAAEGDPGTRRWSAAWRTVLAADAPGRAAEGECINPQEGAQSLSPFWKDTTSFLTQFLSHQKPRGGPRRAGKDRDCRDPAARDEKRDVYTPFPAEGQ